MLLRLAPFLFVLLWSTGFLASKVAVQYAEPATLMAIRFGITAALLATAAAALRTEWPRGSALVHSAITGILIHTAYIGGVLWALRFGMPAGVVAVVVCLQPVLTAILAGPLLGERPGLWHWIGLAVGFVGVLLVLSPKVLPLLEGEMGGAFGVFALGSVITALLAITLGTLNQKRHGSSGALVGHTAVQYIAASAVALMIAVPTETMRVEWTAEFVASLAWLVIVLSIGAIGLLMIIIRASAMSSVTSLFYLVPAVTAAMSAFVFGERLEPVQFAGMALVMAAVAAIRLRPAAASVPDRSPPASASSIR
ncbi:MAG: DMT family transporter [Hyphomicrobiaceae bacterium]|nr:DMT family transporter [Hyphomicrobiaceae bacterium]